MCDSYTAEIAVLYAQSQAFFAHPRHVGEFAILKDIKGNNPIMIKRLWLYSLILLVLILSHPVAYAAQTGSDWVSTPVNLNLCLAADGETLSGAPARMVPCQDDATQKWHVDSEGQWHVQADTAYCLGLDSDEVWFNNLVVLPCENSRVRGFTAEIQPNQSVHYTIMTDDENYELAIDSGGEDGQLTLYYADPENIHQQWRWFQTDLVMAESDGCAIDYPFPASDLDSYQREIACDRVAQMQPPYNAPAGIVRDASVFPGSVSPDLPRVSQTFAFNLDFKNHDYLRIDQPPANWLNTDLYAPPNAIVRVTLSDDVRGVSVMIGVHTDTLYPDSGNVVESGFLRYPNVITRLPLQAGENLVRSPYGGPIVLISDDSYPLTAHITIADAVMMPYLKVGVTTMTEWEAARTNGVPYGSLQSDLAVIYAPSSELSALSYEDAVAIADYYSTFGTLHNQLAGLDDANAPTHQPPQGQYWHVADRQISAGWGHSGYPLMYFNEWSLATPNSTITSSNGTWGQYHELGHNYQMPAWSDVFGTEVTVNLFSLHAQEVLTGTTDLVSEDTYTAAIAMLNDPSVVDKWMQDGADDPFIQLVFLDQIRLGFPDLNWSVWTTLMRRYRDMPQDQHEALDTDQKKRDRFMTELCDITKTNLAPHFDAWTIPVGAEAKTTCAAYPPLTQDIWQGRG